MTKRRPLNDLGLWLLPELNRRNIPQKAFARLLHTTPQNLTDLLRGRRFHSQLNACHLSPLHFEEVVLDHIGR